MKAENWSYNQLGKFQKRNGQQHWREGIYQRQ